MLVETGGHEENTIPWKLGIRLAERTEEGWGRKARDAKNLLRRMLASLSAMNASQHLPDCNTAMHVWILSICPKH